MKRTDLSALTDLLAAGTITDSESQRLVGFVRQVAQAQPVGTVAQHSYETFQSCSYGDGKVTPWTLKRPHAAPMLFRELEVGTALYTLPLED